MLTKLTDLGLINIAHDVAKKAEALIPAYSLFIKDQNPTNFENFTDRPLMEKSNYIDKYDFERLLVPNRNSIVSYHRSSGFSKKSTYWPAINEGSEFLPEDDMLVSMRKLYDLDNNKIMHMVAFSLGSWVGGDSISVKLKTMFSELDCPSMVYAPGNDYRDCIETLVRFQNDFDLFVIYITPSSISDLLMTAASMGHQLPFEKIRYIVGGELFPESLRVQIQSQMKEENRRTALLSIYGAADAGVIGVESPYSVAVRQILHNDTIRKKLNITDGIPLFHHKMGDQYYAEEIDGQLVLTLWQGIPLVRYNIKDRVDLFSWADLKSKVLSLEANAPEYAKEFDILKEAPDDLADILAIYGRSDRGVILSGSNISENIINQAIRSSVGDITQGKYQAEVVFGKHHNQRLAVLIEVPILDAMNSTISKTVQKNITKKLCELQGEFEHDYSKRFATFDDDPERSIVTVEFVQWPYFSEKNAGQIKHKIV